ncbi:hypothetical protein PD885_03763 [Xanthomonas fragariae]|uniref:Uncharacterized protein n=1 Tax=Xanthomonas fragariae TaxID=48664 RepID=A0ABY1RUM6_9XANT|nr:hypothetical protein NBC2815_03729 [Xanthomonas fragariae]SMR00983.1 hypothetical protein PD885_03763 [Xanthomonas fragariae]
MSLRIGKSLRQRQCGQGENPTAEPLPLMTLFLAVVAVGNMHERIDGFYQFF